jgi:hypothetical protein
MPVFGAGFNDGREMVKGGRGIDRPGGQLRLPTRRK